MSLPLFLTQGNKYILGALMYGISYSFYYFTNHHLFFQPHFLPMNAIDQAFPFLPYSVLVYISEYFYFAFVFILMSNFDNINKYLYAFFFLETVSCTIFIFYPTIYPRELYPIPTDLPNWLQATWSWLRTQDAATNCFPSLHVSSVYLSAFVLRTDSRRDLFWPFFIWGTLIAFSTLTTKQHYFIDILSGFLFALFFYWWFFHRQEYTHFFRATSARGINPAPIERPIDNVLE